MNGKNTKQIKGKGTQALKGGNETVQMPFGRENYILLLVGLVVIGLGYLLMIGGNSEDPNVFNEAVFNTQRLTVAPIVIIIGFIIEGYAILKRPKEEKKEQ